MAAIGATPPLVFVAINERGVHAIAPVGNDGSTIGTGPSLSAGVRPTVGAAWGL